MRVRWYGQSAFRLVGGGMTVFIDPFGAFPPEALAARRMRFEYPAIAGVTADVLLITHEHFDHNAAEAIDGAPHTVRATAGTWPSPIGTVLGVASEHDAVAGTQRGPNSIFVFSLDGLRVCHLGDLGQPQLRPEQREAIGPVDLLFVPVGGGPTLGAESASATVRALAPRLVVPMHYRTPAVSFLEPADAFLEHYQDVRRLPGPEFETEGLLPGSGPMILVPAVPTA